MKKIFAFILVFCITFQISAFLDTRARSMDKSIVHKELSEISQNKCIRITSVNSSAYPEYVIFQYNDSCKTVTCYSEITSTQCSIFKLNFENGYFYYNAVLTFTGTVKSIDSKDYLIAQLDSYEESEPCSIYVGYKVLERYFDKDEPYVIVENASGQKYALMTGNNGSTFQPGICYIQEVFETNGTMDGYPVYCPTSDQKNVISRLSGEICMSVVEIKEFEKSLVWIVEDGYGIRYAVKNGNHNKASVIDLSEKREWLIKFDKVARVLIVEGIGYPLLSVEKYKYLYFNECYQTVQKGKGQKLALRFQILKPETNNLGVEALDENGTVWVLVGTPSIMLDLEKENLCIFAIGEGFYYKKSLLSQPDTFLIESWEFVDCIDITGGKLFEGKVVKLDNYKGPKKSPEPTKVISVQMFSNGTINDYFLSSDTMPLKWNELRADDCIQFNSIGGFINYCEKIQCKKITDYKKVKQVKGWLDLGIGLNIGGLPFYWIYLTTCEGEEISLVYLGGSPPEDKRTGRKISEYRGCAVFGLKNGNLEWWETSEEPCCISSGMGLRAISNQSIFYVKCDKKPKFQISLDNNSKEILKVSIKPKKNTNLFQEPQPTEIIPGTRQIIEFEPEKLEQTLLSKYFAEVYVNEKLVKTLIFIVINQNIKKCEEPKNIEFVIPIKPTPLCEGEMGYLNVFVFNKCTTKPIKINFEKMDNWLDINLDENPVLLEAWETKQIKISYKQPKQDSSEFITIRVKAVTGTVQTYEIAVTSKFKPLDVCKPCCDFEVQTPEISAQLCQNEEKIFKFKVSNKCAKEKISFNVKPVGNNMPASIEPDKFELETGQSKEISVKVAHSKNEKEMNWQLDVLASCDMKKTVNFVTNLKPPEDCDPCFGFSASISDPNKTELCENEEGNILVLLENKNKNKAMDALIKVVIKSEKPETIEKNIKLQPLTKTSVAMVFKQPKKAGANNTLVDVSVAYCGKIEAKQLKFPYKSDQICKPCCNFKATPEKTEFAKVKAGAKIKSSITIENLCDTPASYTITGTKDIVFSQTKFDLKGRKSQKITLTITVPKSNAKSLTLPITITSCGSSIKKTVNIKLAY